MNCLCAGSLDDVQQVVRAVDFQVLSLIARELSVRYRAGRRRARYRPSFRADASFRTFRCAQPFVQLRPAPASRRVAHRDGHRLLFGIVV